MSFTRLPSGTLSVFFRRLSEALTHGPVALATVVATQGSTPRVAGARQFLTSAGDSCGTIGGGATEARVLELAGETLADGQPRAFQADLRGRPGDVREGVCGGTMNIWIIRLHPEPCLALLRNVTESLHAGRRVSLSTRLDTLNPLALTAAGEAFTEILEPAPRLLIVGAGHIGRSLARLAIELDFTVVVQDERPEWLTPAAFPFGCALEPHIGTAVEALRNWEGRRFAALVTRGFSQDVAALDLLNTIDDLSYLGLLGSRTRVATVLAAHRTSGGFPPKEGILHAPVGIEIGAETPEEIAVSIAAELIQVRRARHGSRALARTAS